MLPKTLLLVSTVFAGLFAGGVQALTKVDLETGAAVRAVRAGAGGERSPVLKDFHKLMENPDRELFESCDSNFFLECLGSENAYTGSCGGLSEKKADKWCVLAEGSDPVCCGDSSSDCCELTGGGIAVTLIVLVVAVCLIVLASCACCTCCPYHKHLCCANCCGANQAPQGVVVAQPQGVVVSQPQGVVVSQPQGVMVSQPQGAVVPQGGTTAAVKY